MGTLTRLQLVTNIQKRLGGRTDQDDQIVIAINQAQEEIARSFEFEDNYADPDTVTISNTGDTSVDQVIDLPTNLNHLHSLTLYESGDEYIKELTALPKKYWEQLIAEPSLQTRNEPDLYVQIDDKVYLFPVPDATYTVRRLYTVYPTDLSADTDVSILKNKDDLIIYKATADMMLLLGMEQKANTYFRSYRNKLQEAQANSYHPDTNLGKSTKHGIGRFVPNYHQYPFLNKL